MHPDHAQIGPNAIIQTVEVLRDRYGTPQATAWLQEGGLAHLVTHMPTTMVDEAEFHRLVHLLMGQLGSQPTASLLDEAGRRTARYLLAHRIPRFFQTLVGMLPQRLGLRLLLLAIGQHAWTFAGSGTFSFVIKQHPVIHVIVSYPSVRPVAHFYGGTFVHLVGALIDEQVDVHVSTCRSDAGSIDCTYTLTFCAW